MLDILPQHADGTQFGLRAVGGDRAGAGCGIIAEKPLKNGELGLAVAEQFHILARSGGGNGGHADLRFRLQLDLGQGGERDANRIVGAAGRRGRQDIVLRFLGRGHSGTQRNPKSHGTSRDHA